MEFRFITRFPVFKIWTLDFKENKISKWISDEVIWDVDNHFHDPKNIINKKDNINSLFDKRTNIIYNNIQYIHYIHQYTYIIWYIDINKIYKGYTISNNI